VTSLHLPLADCQAEHLALLVEHVRKQGGQSALLVVQPAGSRFTARLARKYFERAGMTAYVTYSPGARSELLESWWRTHWKAQKIIWKTCETALDLLYAQCR
jgi:hypothetical protein